MFEYYMNLVGGLRRNIRSYDFKYTLDTTRKNWIKSVFPHVESLVNIVADIPYHEYNYRGDIIYTTRGISSQEYDTFEESLKNKQIDTYEILFQDRVILPDNSLHYNFFGGICFELLNDTYPNVNLYDFVDPTSDIDIKISFKMNDSAKKKISHDNYKLIGNNPRYEDIDVNLFLVVNPTITEPTIPPYLNPYFADISNFIFNYMLLKLNELSLSFENSVEFDINEYDGIDNEVKKEELGYKVIDIANSNAKLIRYLDRDEKTLRIQIVLKIIVDGESIIDHLLEFLINPDSDSIDEILSLEKYNISSIYTLFLDNLEAYNKRKSFLEVTGPRMHKPINHFTRFIYLLDLIKKNPQIYNPTHGMLKNIHSKYILKHLNNKEYLYYVIKDNQFIKKEIPTINIIYAFYNIFTNVFNPTYIKKYLDIEITQEEEEQYYNILMSSFKINASPFRKFLLAKGKKNKKTNKRYKKRTQKNKRYKKHTQKNKRYKKHTQKH